MIGEDAVGMVSQQTDQRGIERTVAHICERLIVSSVRGIAGLANTRARRRATPRVVRLSIRPTTPAETPSMMTSSSAVNDRGSAGGNITVARAFRRTLPWIDKLFPRQFFKLTT